MFSFFVVDQAHLINSILSQVLRLEPYMGEDVPVRWFNFERVVEALVQKKIFYLKVSQLYFIVSKTCFIEDETEMVAMLDFYHDLGIIIWHGDTVVLQTQWLIHLFRKLITIRPFDEQVLCLSFLGNYLLLLNMYFQSFLQLLKGDSLRWLNLCWKGKRVQNKRKQVEKGLHTHTN